MTVHDSAPSDWDSWLAEAGAESSYTQTSHWARINEAVNGVRPIWVDVVADGRRVAGVLVGLRKLNPHGAAQFASQILRGFGDGTLDCAGGPVVLPGHTPSLGSLLGEIAGVARQFRARAIVFANPPATASWLEAPDAADAFARAGYIKTPWHTSLVDLARTDEDLLRGFRASARKGIRRCQELGLVVRQCRDREDYLAAFSRPLFATRAALGMKDAPHAAERQWWELDRDRHYRFVVAQDREGEVLGMLGTYRWNGLATEIMSERTMMARRDNLPVQDLLHWEAFVTHRDLGDGMFDLAGFSPDPASPKEKGIRAFKEKWQGRTVQIPRYDRAFDPIHLRLAKRIIRKISPARESVRI